MITRTASPRDAGFWKNSATLGSHGLLGRKRPGRDREKHRRFDRYRLQDVTYQRCGIDRSTAATEFPQADRPAQRLCGLSWAEQGNHRIGRASYRERV